MIKFDFVVEFLNILVSSINKWNHRTKFHLDFDFLVLRHGSLLRMLSIIWTHNKLESCFTEQTDQTWVPVAALAMYVVTSMIGLLNIPWTMTAELFPIEIRGMAHSLSNAFAYLLMFVAIQTYYGMKDFFNGLVGMQLFYAAISVSGSLYVLLVLPETHKKKLKEIEEYFLHNTFYLCQKKKSKPTKKTRSVQKMTKLSSKDIVKTSKDVNTSQNEKLLPRWKRIGMDEYDDESQIPIYYLLDNSQWS